MANKVLAETGVIGGTGLYAMKELRIIREISIKTPFGSPSDKIILGTLSGIKVAFLPRHGRKHAMLPGEINQRANMWALKSIGVKTIISASAVGSLRQKFAPTHFVFPDQFVDQTKGRPSTFLGDGIVGHVPLADPFCMNISDMMYKEAKKLGITCHKGGTYCCMEGPGFSTKAESEFHRKMGYSIIGMTMATEAKLAREAGFHYAPVSLVTDYDCWKEGEEVNQHKVSETVHANVENIRRLLVKAIPLVAGAGCRNGCPSFIKNSLLTHKDNFPPKTYKKLKLILG
ncbi:MAG: S-methyl-5'-thioadenosine phosphorylase [Elusimicrobia bacterium CG_4_10_14_0_2_um_filter_56_8]|nr:MAG: methylthioadenosine phosphorylase [Elusimicrobia bacterium CG1_02_56_21]PJA16718.1 MAG: S-methyl-5'-thioadenosine phosphorylase [Elusimicrobia bacterium CG_4_10_14_0_2_um_filter_56_8]